MSKPLTPADHLDRALARLDRALATVHPERGDQHVTDLRSARAEVLAAIKMLVEQDGA